MVYSEEQQIVCHSCRQSHRYVTVLYCHRYADILVQHDVYSCFFLAKSLPVGWWPEQASI